MIEAKAVPYQRKMTVGKVISFTFAKVFKEINGVGQWILLMLLVALMNLIPLGLIMFSIMGTYSYLPALGSVPNPFENANLAFLIPGAVLMLLVFIADIGFGIFSLAWFNRLGLDAFDGEKRLFGERFKLAMTETYRLVGPVLLLGLAGIVAMIPYYISSAVDAGGSLVSDPAPVTSGLTRIFYFVGLCISYYISVKTVASYGLLLEKPELQIMECFKTSFDMTKGRGWRILGYYICLGILVFLLCLALIIPGIIVWVVAAVTDFNIGATVIAVVLSSVLYMLLLAFSGAAQGMFTAGVYKFLMIEHTEEVVETATVSESLEVVEVPEENEKE